MGGGGGGGAQAFLSTNGVGVGGGGYGVSEIEKERQTWGQETKYEESDLVRKYEGILYSYRHDSTM